MKVLLVTALFSSLAYGQVSQVDIKNFNFNYSAPAGEGTADSFSYQQKLEEAQKVYVQKNGEDFDIHLEGVENRDFTFKNPPSLIKDAQSIKLSAFNLAFQDKLTLSMNSAAFNSPDKDLEMKNLTLGCDRVATFTEVMDQVISGCVQKMSVKTSNFSSAGAKSIEQAFMKAFDEGHDEDKAAVGVKNLDLKIAAGKLTLSAEIKAQISGTAKASGTVSYAVSTKKLTVKLSEVKFGILDVTSKVFDELEKQESANLQVSKPYIYITIK